MYCGSTEKYRQAVEGVPKGAQTGISLDFMRLLADSGEAKGCSTNTFVIHSLID